MVRHHLQRRRGRRRTPTATASSTATTRCCSRGCRSTCRSRCCAICSSTRRGSSWRRSRINRDIADTRLRESLVHTTADVKSAYWNLVSARANVDARRSALELAQELVRVNKAKVDVGTSPPLDLVSAQAEVAAEPGAADHRGDRRQAGRGSPAPADLRHRRSATTGTSQIEPIDSPPVGTPALDVDAAVTTRAARPRRSARARKDIENAADRRQVRRQSAAARRPRQRQLSGERPRRHAGAAHRRLPRHDRRTGRRSPPSASVLDQLFAQRLPDVGGRRQRVVSDRPERRARPTTRATQLERAQAAERLKSAEARAIQQVRDAAWKIEMNAKRIETTRVGARAGRAAARRRAKRFEVGMSTSFLVIQAQRDLAQAKTNELCGGARLRPVAGGFRGAAAGGAGGPGSPAVRRRLRARRRPAHRRWQRRQRRRASPARRRACF